MEIDNSLADMPDHVGRGVWTAPFRTGGYPVIIAVDSQGILVASIVQRPGIEPEKARDILLVVLDAVDPVARPAKTHLALLNPTDVRVPSSARSKQAS
jgi:hypothetical protein